MNIQKGKVVKNLEWSATAQKRLASMLGVSAMLSAAALTACDLGTSTSGDVVNPPEESSSSSSGLLHSSSSVRLDSLEITSGEIIPSVESSSSSVEEYPPQAGIMPPPEPESGSPIDQYNDYSSSSSEPEYPPLAGVITAPESSSSSVEVSSSSENELEIETTLTAGLPVIEDPEPEPLSGDVAEPDVIYIDDPKD